ncbi:MAG TPA: TatD family hydrolase [Geothrix sp.]|nr:TatD family hydrolase [Geothrix sp.]
MRTLFDAHSHLSAALIPNHPRVVCGTREADWEAVLAQATSDSQALPMLGLHPWFAAEASAEWATRLESLLRSHRAGVGECGLDFARKEESDRAAQAAAFRAQLQLAHRLHRPVAMHVVRAWGPLLDLLREEGIPAAGAMIHSYSGSPETAQSLQAMGVFLSFSGDLLNPERTKVRESLLSVDSRLLLLETDGTADLVQVVHAAAQIRGVHADDLAAQTWENGRRCFKELMA